MKSKNLQPVEVVKVKRSQIKFHPDNPRYLDEVGKKKLWKSLDKVGFLDIPIVQKSTGYILAGNQRVKWLDEKYGNQDYELLVGYVDLDDKKAKAVMVLLNNPTISGEFDLPKLENVLLDIGDIELTGFDQVQIELMFPESKELSKLFGNPPEEMEKIVEDLKKTKTISKEERKKMKEKVLEKEDTDIYIVVVFNSVEEKQKFLTEKGIDPRERYISADVFFAKEVKSDPNKNLPLKKIEHKEGYY